MDSCRSHGPSFVGWFSLIESLHRSEKIRHARHSYFHRGLSIHRGKSIVSGVPSAPHSCCWTTPAGSSCSTTHRSSHGAFCHHTNLRARSTHCVERHPRQQSPRSYRQCRDTPVWSTFVRLRYERFVRRTETVLPTVPALMLGHQKSLTGIRLDAL